ncbi:MAG: hypothetical protein H8D67_10855, partial [Deltaproteobacteria bacterium]|nr:hypothetical protein [Deltaproteobacteria bacterium]
MVDDFKKYFTVKDIAKKFGDTEEWIRDLIQAKKIKAAKIGPQKDSQIGEKTVEIAVEKTVEKILILLKANPQITQKGIMNNTGLT